MGNFVSKTRRRSRHDGINLNQNGYSSSRGRRKPLSPEVLLHEAARKGDYAAAEDHFGDENLIKHPITEGGEIALHIAAIEGRQDFVSKLLEVMEREDLAIQNAKGCTALCFAAAGGHIEIAQLMLEKDPNLAKVKGDEGVWPLYMAALQGFGEMAELLLIPSDIVSWTQLEKADLLTSAIDSGLYDLAIKIVVGDKTLALAKDANGLTPLEVLARKPVAFSSDNGQGFWDNITRNVLKYMNMSKTNDVNVEKWDIAYTLMDVLWDAVESCKEDVEAGVGVDAADSAQLFFIAAEAGNDEFLVELFKKDHNLLYKVNEDSHSIFHVAVRRRYNKVFSLMFELGGTKDLLASYIDAEGNNILHLAGKLAPQNQLDSIPGAPWQMQREVLWFKVVEKLVQPAFRHKKNSANQTPHELFMSEHKKLREEAEKYMKQTAKSCMLVTMLIATVVFTAAFTVPGGYDGRGAPTLENRKMFVVFPVSEAVATLSSLTSMLMFLSILTSRYSDKDFLVKLPFWMVVGVATLFFSIVAMMVAFCSCLLFFEHGWVAVALLLLFFGIVPAMFVVLKYPLLRTIFRCTYSCTWLFRSDGRLHS
ncbi:ankyrin repeat-containing protein At5g02620-like [Salvia splendens]|uniref:ankyrin repeat-containing protein At5g02620-like n=1 Tax=Salvia splendens TaxID=180675 RepID=UPI001C26BF77|nr:ankyrin repeat-containing protein At5g02620-like [Salvia splendens]